MAGPEDERFSGVRAQQQVLWRRKWIILLTIGIAVALSAAYSVHKTREYQATATLELTTQLPSAVLQAQNSSASSVAATVDVPTAIQVLQSSQIQKAVAQSISGVPPVSASQVGTTNVVQLAVRAPNAATAARAVNLYATDFIAAERVIATTALAAAIKKLQTGSKSANHQVLVLQNRLAHTATGPVSDNLSATLSAAEESSLSIRAQLSGYQTDLALTTGGGVLIGKAALPSSPVVPKPVEYILAALLVGGIIGAALAVFLDRFDDRIRSEADAEVALGRVPILGKIPNMRVGEARPLVAIETPFSPAAEAYRLIRTVLQYVMTRESVVCIEVTSPRQGDGKTMTTVNLAVAFALAGLKVVIVDCDLRLPQIHSVFDVPRKPGLTDLVIDGIDLDRVVHQMHQVPNLSVVPAGSNTALPAEFLSSPGLRDALRKISDGVDIVLLDTPPVNPVADAAALVPATDGVLLVLSVGQCTRRDLVAALSKFETVNADIIGCVVNRATRGDFPRQGYRYGYGTTPESGPAAADLRTDDGEESGTPNEVVAK